MRNEVTSLSFRSIEKDSPVIDYVDTSTLAETLYGDIFAVGPATEYASELSLEQFAEGIDMLYKNTKDVSVHDVGDIDQIDEQINLERQIETNTGLDRSEHIQRLVILRDEKAFAERSSVAYIDPEKDDIGYTAVLQGEYQTTGIDIFGPILLDGHSPLLAMHTHPDESLPSGRVDYLPLLLQDPKVYGRRCAGGIMVLCPESQILALPTHRTPLMNIRQAQAYPDRLSNSYEEKDALMFDKHESRIINLYTLLAEQNRYSIEFYSKFAEELAKYMKDEEVDEEEARKLFSVFTEEYAFHNDAICNIVEGFLEEAKVRFDSFVNYSDNRINQFVPRELGIELYYSDNRKDFVKF